MPLPEWAKEKSSNNIIETKNDRLLTERIKKTIEREQSDPDLSFPNTGIVQDRSTNMLQAVETQYEGNTLDYHGHS
jgi:hypothetical protein